MKIKQLTLALLFSACAATMQAQPYNEPYRPQYHFSPARGWIGDPCGLTYYKGQYHLFWWGKTVSTDLVHYREVSPNVMEDTPPGISNFTGSVLIDKHNTAGWGPEAWVAAMTVYEKDSKKQAQGLAFSHDGVHFSHFDKNPVIDLWSTEFRDPTVFWHEQTRRWVMVVAKALEKKVKFYSSANLKDWTWESDFGPAGDQEKSWECPDLFQVPVNGNWNNRRWVMVVSVNWAQEQYFIGDFDGHKFTLMDGHPQQPLYVDRGLDYYASRVVRDYDDTLHQSITLGWVATWDYAQQAPSTWGKGFWSLPRLYGLTSFAGEGLRLTQTPLPALQQLRGKLFSKRLELPVGAHPIAGFAPKSNQYELDVTFDTSRSNTFGFYLAEGNGHKTVVSYDTDARTLLIDRTNAADVEIPKFSRITKAEVQPEGGKLRLHVYVDRSSIEIFANRGKEVFTLLTYAGNGQTGIETFAHRPGTRMELQAWPLRSIWNP